MGVSRLKTIIIVMDFIRYCIFPNSVTIIVIPTCMQYNTLSREMNQSLQFQIKSTGVRDDTTHRLGN